VLGVVERQVGVVSVTAEVGRAILVPVSREFLTFSISKRFFYIRVLRDLHPRSRVRVSGEKVGLRRMEFSIFYVNSVIFIY
jgi:hypothetical protein